MELKKHYNSIYKVMNSYRFFALLIIVGNLCVSCFFGYILYNVTQNNIMVVDGQGDILSASKTSEDNLLKIESDNHIRLFYSRFFSYDKLNYKKRTEQGLHLVGKSGVNLYETYKIKGWFDVVVNNDLIIESNVQTIKFSNFENKILFETTGFQKIKRGDNIAETRNLNIKGSISIHPNGRQIETNPHGLIIEDLVVINNSVVKNEKQENLTSINSIIEEEYEEKN
jgi:hypothetical protein